jgi:hypothetical protein
VADVVVRLERNEVRGTLSMVEKRIFDAGQHVDPSWRRFRDKLRAALDSPPVEGNPHYRVVGKRNGRTVTIRGASAGGTSYLSIAEHDLKTATKGFREARIQVRRISFLSDGSKLIEPWVDLASEEGD